MNAQVVETVWKSQNGAARSGAVASSAERAMRILFMIGFLFLSPAIAAQERTGIEPSWRPIDSLSDADRALIDATLARSYWDVEDIDRWRHALYAALVSVPDGDLLFFQTPNFATCGEIRITVFGPMPVEGERKTLIDDICVDEIRYRFGRASYPDLLTSFNNLVDELYLWNGSVWFDVEFIESLDLRRGPSGNHNSGPDARFRALVGKRDVAPIFADPEVREMLSAMPKGDYLTLLRNLTVWYPSDFYDNCIYYDGARRHKTNVERATLAVCERNSLHVAIASEDGHRLYSFGDHRNRQPWSIRKFIKDECGVHEQQCNFEWIR